MDVRWRRLQRADSEIHGRLRTEGAGFAQIPAGDIALLKETIGDTTAAILIEAYPG